MEEMAYLVGFAYRNDSHSYDDLWHFRNNFWRNKMGLKYEYPEDGSKSCEKKPLKVRFNGKITGEIKKEKNGYQFYGVDKKKSGVLHSIGAVQIYLTDNQPTRESFKAEKTEEESLLNKAKKELKRVNEEYIGQTAVFDRAVMLLGAVAELLQRQKDSKTVINILEETTTYDEAECDGFALLQDITDLTE